MTPINCKLLETVLKRYEQHIPLSTLQALFALLCVVSVANALFVFFAFGIFSCETSSTLCALLSFVFSCTLFAGFFVLYASLERFSLHSFARNETQLKEVAAKCGITLAVREDYRFSFMQRTWFGQVSILTTCFALVINLYKFPIGFLSARARRHPLKKFRVNEEASIEALQNEVCAICLDEMDNGVLDTLNCGHSYHDVCITRWSRMSDSPSCPMCKTAIYGGRGSDGRTLSLCFNV